VLVVIVIDHIFELARFLLGTALPFFFRIAFDFARFCGWPNVLALACVILSAWWIHRRLAPAPAPAPPPALPPSPSPPPASSSTASPLDVLRADFQSHFGIPAGYFSPGFDYDYGTDTRTEDSVARGSLGDEFDLRLLREEKWRKLGLDVSRYGQDQRWLDKSLGWTAAFHGTTAADGTLNSIILIERLACSHNASSDHEWQRPWSWSILLALAGIRQTLLHYEMERQESHLFLSREPKYPPKANE